MVYSWIYNVYPPSIWLVYLWISMEYHMMYIHDVYTVYPWIFLDIPGFWIWIWNQILLLARVAGLIQCAHVFYSTRHYGNCARRKGCPQKAQPGCRQPSPSVAGGGGDGGAAAAAAVSLAYFCFSSLVTGNNLILGERWGRGSLQRLYSLDAYLRWKSKKKNLVARAVDHVLVMNLKDWLEYSLQLNWILNFLFHLIRKQQTHDNTKLQSKQYGTGI